MRKDKNGKSIEQDGHPVRLLQTADDYQRANTKHARTYWTKIIDGEPHLIIPLSEFKNGDTDFHSVERY